MGRGRALFGSAADDNGSGGGGGQFPVHPSGGAITTNVYSLSRSINIISRPMEENRSVKASGGADGIDGQHAVLRNEGDSRQLFLFPEPTIVIHFCR